MRMKIGETGVGVLVMVVCRFVDGMRAIDARRRVCRCVQEVAGVAGVSPGAVQAMRGWRQRCPSWTGRRQAPRLGLGRVVDSTPLQSVVVSGPVSDPPHARYPDVGGKGGCEFLFASFPRRVQCGASSENYRLPGTMLHVVQQQLPGVGTYYSTMPSIPYLLLAC